MRNISKFRIVKDIISINGIYVEAVKIKEDTDVEFPVAVIPFPIGGRKGGLVRQNRYAKLLAATPELLEKLERLIKAIEPLDEEILKLKYANVVSAWKAAKELIKYLEYEEVF